MSAPTAATILPLQQQQLQQLDWRLDDFTYFRKCGELTASSDLKAFSLNCQFCPGICLQFEVFLQHLREQHSQDIKELYLKDTNQNTNKTEQATQTEAEEVVEVKEAAAAAALVDSSLDSSNSNSIWNEITLMHDEGEELEKQPPEMGPSEEVGLVYIMENATMQCELLAEEMEEEKDAIIDPFAMFNGSRNENNINGSRRKRVGGAAAAAAGGAGGVVSENQEGLKQSEEGEKKKKTTTSAKGWKNHAEPHNELYEKPRTRRQTNAIAAKSTPREGDFKTPTVREVEHNKEIVSYLLDAYKNNAKLWNPKDPHYKYNANRKVFDELSAPLERDMNCALSGTEIFTIIKGLRSNYRRELTKAKAQRRGKFKSRLWYFDKMAFLRSIIEHKRAERAAKNRLDESSDESENYANSTHEPAESADATASAISLQNKAVLSFLLTTFKRQERLWDPEHPDYKNSNKNEHYDNIAEELRQNMNVSITGEQCFAEINKLRLRYRNELRMLNKRKGMHVPKLWCFEQMDFLGKILEERLRKRKACIAAQPRAPYLKAQPIAFTSDTEQLQFIGIYRNYSALWDVDHPDYRSVRFRNAAFSQLLEELNSTLELNANFDQLQNTLYQMRKTFSAEKQQILLRNEDTTSAPAGSSSPIYAALAEFLDMNLGPFRCEFCAEMIKTSDQYKIHLSGHDGTPPFICTLCGKGFQIASNLSIHIRRHKGDFPYGCDECEKSFATSTEVTNHKRTHTGERPFVCDLCGKSFKTWSFFDVHRRSKHMKQSSQFHCPICEKDFYERNRYTDHMNRHLNIRKHLCTVCGKSYTTFANLQKHMELHAAVKKYKCTVCSMRFAQYPSLRFHKRKAHAPQMEQ